jgi:GNAT superfamily N-acetyltransferase
MSTGVADDAIFTFRKANAADIPALAAMHRASLFALGGRHYGPAALEGMLADIPTADPALIADRTYTICECAGTIVASGGWTFRRPCYEDATTDHGEAADAARAAPTATIRAVFTHPGYARRGLGRTIMELVETEAAILGGAERLELCATLSGVPLYERLGYAKVAPVRLALSNGATFDGWRMEKPALRETGRCAA